MVTKMKEPAVSEEVEPFAGSIDPPARIIITFGILLAAIWCAVYLVRPDFVDTLQFKLTDAIVADAPEPAMSDRVVVVDIDDPSLEAWGQWPWPRSRLAGMLKEIAGRGARSIALDFIMAERDRTCLKTLHQAQGAVCNEVRLMLSPADGVEAGQERVFSVSAQGIYANAAPDSDSFTGTQGIARDINDRKHLEDKLERSKKMEAMGSLAAGVAHDLNNILSGLVSYPELLLLDLPPDSPMRDSIKTIQRSGQRAADIVQDMLMITRRGAKNFNIINLNDAIRGYLTTPEFKNLARNHPNICVATDLADDLMNVKGSSVHISKVIMNLVTNAGGRVHLPGDPQLVPGHGDRSLRKNPGRRVCHVGHHR